ncbi:hypothetical protein [Bradyrhizobium sp. CCBAU 11386]|uniref:hypothetical protein n=1 Tax=Bradyrhizobium sp. CCBAU 11386 TaxID=1630837 RepID=UPI0023031778|nr:hypothetical protein [Bradyrhizobium sp. CCBAU 11386]
MATFPIGCHCSYQTPFLSNATRQFARVLHDSITIEQWFSSSSAMAQHFLIIQKNLADFPTLPLHECKPSTDCCSVFDGVPPHALPRPATSFRTRHVSATAERPSRNGRLDRQPLHLVNYQFRQVVRDDGHVASVANERRAREGFGCKTDFAAPTALTEAATARRYTPKLLDG